MNVVYHEKARGGEWRSFLEDPMGEMQELLRDASDPVEAEWYQVEDERGHSEYTLTLRDFAGEATARFAPEDLARPNDLRFRLFQVLSELMGIRSRVLMRQIREGREEDGNGANPH